MKLIFAIFLCVSSFNLFSQLQTAIGVAPGGSYLTTSDPFQSEFTYSLGPVIYVGTKSHVLKVAFISGNGNSDFRQIEQTNSFSLAYRFNFEFLRNRLNIHESLIPYFENEFVFQDYTEINQEFTKLEGIDATVFFPKVGLEMKLYKDLWVDLGFGYNVGLNNNTRKTSPWFALKYRFREVRFSNSKISNEGS